MSAADEYQTECAGIMADIGYTAEDTKQLKLAAANGHVQAMLHYSFYLHSMGKHAEGAKFCEQAALNGSPDAALRTAAIFDAGIGVDVDNQKVEKYLKLAVDLNEPGARVEYGIFLIHNQRFSEAIEPLKDSVKRKDSGYSRASYYLASLYDNGLGTRQNKKSAQSYLDIAVKAKDAKALYTRATFLMEDKKTYREAAIYAAQSARYGSRQAKALVENLCRELGYEHPVRDFMVQQKPLDLRYN